MGAIALKARFAPGENSEGLPIQINDMDKILGKE